jgi:hypothetical protein
MLKFIAMKIVTLQVLCTSKTNIIPDIFEGNNNGIIFCGSFFDISMKFNKHWNPLIFVIESEI